MDLHFPMAWVGAILSITGVGIMAGVILITEDIMAGVILITMEDGMTHGITHAAIVTGTMNGIILNTQTALITAQGDRYTALMAGEEHPTHAPPLTIPTIQH
jgi:hypothetical protein